MLLDTSGFLCLVHRDETQHLKAKQSYERASGGLIHNYFLDEFIALAQARKLRRDIALEFSEAWLNSSKVEVVWIDERVHRSGLKLLRARADKTYSLCDAVSFVLMRERGIREALTTDKHFEQEGFVRLLGI